MLIRQKKIGFEPWKINCMFLLEKLFNFKNLDTSAIGNIEIQYWIILEKKTFLFLKFQVFT